MTLIAALLLSATAHAGCDAEMNALNEATPVSTAKAWNALAGCDSGAAYRAGPAALEKMLADDDAYTAVSTMVGMGMSDEVTTWIQAQEAGHRSKAIASLGDNCSEPIEDYLLTLPEKLGEDFWKQRWYRGMAGCTGEKTIIWLGEQLEAAAADAGVDDTRFTGILGVYARNAGGEGIPKLIEVANTVQTDERKGYVVSSFADAARVGSAEGMDGDTALKATQAIIELAPTLGTRAVENARATLTSLGAQANADGMAQYRWPDAYDGGTYSYAVAIRELTTCKNKKKAGTLHWATFTEPGGHWPDQLEAIVKTKLEPEWELGAFAKKCKGEATITYHVPTAPFAGGAERDEWLDGQKKGFHAATEGFDKKSVEHHEDFAL